VNGDLSGIARARRLSEATMRNIRQNLFFAFVYNVLGVPLAAGVLYPVLGLLLSPMVASAAMTFSSVSVIANVLRLRRVDSEQDALAPPEPLLWSVAGPARNALHSVRPAPVLGEVLGRCTWQRLSSPLPPGETGARLGLRS
jgi:hypothetical protein